MPLLSHFRHTHEPKGKDVGYWRNRAIRAEVELYALRRNLMAVDKKAGFWKRILNRLTSGS